MEVRPAVFFAVQAAACIYAVRRGGQPERIIASAMAVAAIATAFPSDDPAHSYRTIEWRGFEVDLLFMLILAVVASLANRFWPIWMASVHLDAIAVHAVRSIEPDMLPSVYSASTGWAAYPMIAMLIVGTYRHNRRAMTQPDRDWSPARW